MRVVKTVSLGTASFPLASYKIHKWKQHRPCSWGGSASFVRDPASALLGPGRLRETYNICGHDDVISVVGHAARGA